MAYSPAKYYPGETKAEREYACIGANLASADRGERSVWSKLVAEPHHYFLKSSEYTKLLSGVSPKASLKYQFEPHISAMHSQRSFEVPHNFSGFFRHRPKRILKSQVIEDISISLSDEHSVCWENSQFSGENVLWLRERARTRCRTVTLQINRRMHASEFAIHIQSTLKTSLSPDPGYSGLEACADLLGGVLLFKSGVAHSAGQVTTVDSDKVSLALYADELIDGSLRVGRDDFVEPQSVVSVLLVVEF